MTAGVPLVVTLSADSATHLPLTFHAQITGNGDSQLYALGQQLGLGYAGSYFLNSMGQNEKWLLGVKSQWYCLLPDGELRRWLGDAPSTLATAALVATLTPGAYNDPTQFWTSPTTGTPPVTFTFAGNQLKLQCDPAFLGSFTVAVSVTDGIANAAQSFIVNVTHRAPVLGAISAQTLPHAQRTLMLSLPLTNPDNDTLALAAQVIPPSQQAYTLKQSLNLTYTGNYWINYYGEGEKWLKGGTAAAPVWYTVLPDGELRRAGANPIAMLADSSLIATLDSSFYQDPSLLWNAQPSVTPPVSFAFSGNQLTITPAVSVLGAFIVQVTVTDGQVTAQQNFTVTVTDSPPVLNAVGAQTMIHGHSLTVNLASNPLSGTFDWTVRTVSPSQQAINLEQTLGLKYTGNYWTNFYGQSEVWLSGVGSDGSTPTWYCLLPDGELRRAGANSASMMSASALVATLDASYYAQPILLWNAQNYAVPQVNYVINGNQVTLTPPANFVGTLLVDAEATDGAVTGRQTFSVTVTNQPPVLNAVANRSITGAGASVTIPLSGSDADGDTLTYSAQAVSASQLAYSLKQTLGISFTGKYWLNYYGDHGKMAARSERPMVLPLA